MPKIKYITPKNVPPPNMVKDLFQRYKRAAGLTSAELGKRLGKSENAVRAKFHNGQWNTKEIAEWCNALGISSAEEVGKAILYR